MTEMEYMSRKYPEYDNYNQQQLDNEYNSLINRCLNLLRDDIEPEFVDFNERMNYIDHILEKRPMQISFINNKDGTTTINISDKPSRSGLILPALDLPKNPRNEKAFAIEDFIKRNYDKSRLDINNENVIELLNSIDVRKSLLNH